MKSSSKHKINYFGCVIFPVYVERTQVGLVAEQDLGVLAVGQVHPHHLLKLGVQVVQPPLHHRQRHRLGDHRRGGDDRAAIGTVTVDGLDLGEGRSNMRINTTKHFHEGFQCTGTVPYLTVPGHLVEPYAS